MVQALSLHYQPKAEVVQERGRAQAVTFARTRWLGDWNAERPAAQRSVRASPGGTSPWTASQHFRNRWPTLSWHPCLPGGSSSSVASSDWRRGLSRISGVGSNYWLNSSVAGSTLIFDFTPLLWPVYSSLFDIATFPLLTFIQWENTPTPKRSLICMLLLFLSLFLRIFVGIWSDFFL